MRKSHGEDSHLNILRKSPPLWRLRTLLQTHPNLNFAHTFPKDINKITSSQNISYCEGNLFCASQIKSPYVNSQKKKSPNTLRIN